MSMDFSRSTDVNTLSLLESALKAYGYFYDEEENSKLRSDMLSKALQDSPDVQEADIRPDRLVYRLPYKYRYIAQRAVIELQDPAFGVSVNDQVKFVEVNYDPDFCPLFAGDDIEWPSVHQTDAMSVQELIDSLPKEKERDVAPPKGLIRRAVSELRALVRC